MESEKTFIRCRDKLIQAGLFEYRKGKKGSPNQYKINTVIFTEEKIHCKNYSVKNTGQMTGKTTVKTTVQMGVNVSNIKDKDKDKDIYFNLINKYKTRAREANNLREKISVIGECKKDNDYINLPMELQDKLFYELMGEEERDF